jgi:NAD-dependent deacetylase
MVYASAEVFQRDPSKYWIIRGDFIRSYGQYQPNAAHYALAELEKMSILRHLITQNIDGLHKEAGSQNVSEIHGSLREIYCLSCRKQYLAPHIPEGDPPYCSCGGVLKPNTVLFGEQLPRDAMERAYSESASCNAMLLIGTSAVVQPAASLPSVAKQNGAAVIEINPEKSFAGANYYVEEKAAAALSSILEAVKKVIKGD